MGLWDSISSGAGWVWGGVKSYTVDTCKLVGKSATDIVSPSTTWENRFRAASNLVGLVPVWGDIAEAACSATSTTIGICKDPANWKQRLTEGATDLAITFCPGPKALLKIPEKAASKWAVKTFKNTADEMVENVMIDQLQPTMQEKTETALAKVEEVGHKAQSLQFKTSHELLQAAKDDYISYLKESGQLKVDEKGQPILGEEDQQVIYSTYKEIKQITEQSGTKVLLSPSHLNNSVLPSFDDMRAYEVDHPADLQAGVDIRSLPNLKPQLEVSHI